MKAKFNVLTRFLLALVFTSPWSSAWSQGDSALNKLDALLSGISTMTADVTQLIVESDGGVLEESLIQMKLKRPQGFYWETLDPFPELIVTDGIYLWNFQPDLEQVVVEDWDASRSELAAQLLSGNTEDLVDEYTVQLRDSQNTEFTEFVLEPLEADNVYSQITLTFHEADLDMIYVQNDNGERTVWQFENIQLNMPLADNLFVFEPGADIEVIENIYVP